MSRVLLDREGALSKALIRAHALTSNEGLGEVSSYLNTALHQLAVAVTRPTDREAAFYVKTAYGHVWNAAVGLRNKKRDLGPVISECLRLLLDAEAELSG